LHYKDKKNINTNKGYSAKYQQNNPLFLQKKPQRIGFSVQVFFTNRIEKRVTALFSHPHFLSLKTS
jgi:hypothetical protein